MKQQKKIRIITMDELEEMVATGEDVYWWAYSWCRENRKTVKDFIRENYEALKEMAAKKKDGLEVVKSS